MKYFITGITGFIGSNLAKTLLADGHQVHALVRNIKFPNQYAVPNLEIFQGDLFDKKVLLNGMKGCQQVFHLAGFAKPWSKDKDMYEKVNLTGTVNILEAARMAGIEKVVFTSSAATIPPSHGKLPSDETSGWKFPFFNAYDYSKRQAELVSIKYSENGLPVTIVNPSRVYGPGPMNASNSVTKMIAGYCNGKWRIIPGDGKKIGNYVFIDDVVHGHILASEKGKPGEIYILGGENQTFDEMFETIHKVSGIYRNMVHMPVWLMLIISRFLESQQKFTGIPPVITPSWIRKYLNDWCISSNKAIDELGYRITPFEEGVRKTLDWLFDSQTAENEKRFNIRLHVPN